MPCLQTLPCLSNQSLWTMIEVNESLNTRRVGRFPKHDRQLGSGVGGEDQGRSGRLGMASEHL
jgi:hypothetical protein